MSGAGTGGGRTRITARALERVTAAVAAEALGRTGDPVSVTLQDADGALDVRIDATIRAVPLARALQEADAVVRSGGPVLDRAASAEAVVRDRVLDLTGHRVGRVAVRITGVRTTKEARVR